jgi:hypothetical protein
MTPPDHIVAKLQRGYTFFETTIAVAAARVPAQEIFSQPGFALDSISRPADYRTRIFVRSSLPMKKFLLLFALLGLLVVPGSAEKIDLGGGKAVLLTLPENWTAADPVLPPAGLPVQGANVRYVTKNGSNDAVLITILTVPDDRFSDLENLKGLVAQATEQFIAGSVEGKADIKEIRLGGVTGYCATFTDANLVGQPSVKDDYKAMTSCFAYLGEHVMVTATVFTDDVNSPAYAEGMRMLKTLLLVLPKNNI